MMIETDQIDRQFNKETKYKEQTCEKDVDIELDLHIHKHLQFYSTYYSIINMNIQSP